MIIEPNTSLVSYTTFGVNVQSKYFVQVHTSSDVRDIVTHELWQQEKHYVIGGGSNILFTQDFDGIIVFNNLKGKKVVEETDEYTIIDVASGENWHEFVVWSSEHNLWGIENLALIPGTVGASPVQNIGAYGVEVEEVIESVTCINLVSGKQEMFTHDQCNFGYRDSIFKQHPGKYFVTSVRYKLSKIPRINIEYGAIVDKLAEQNITSPSTQDMVRVVSLIRQSKLPSVGEIGMAGSFFKNPIISEEHAHTLLQQFPDLKYFPLGNGFVKISAGWIIDNLGYKGVQDGNVGTYYKHALVLVNYGNATGSEVWEFAQKIIRQTHDVFNITLEPEVIIL